MKAYGGVEVLLHAFLNSELDGGEWSASRPGHFIPRERDPGIHCIGCWVGPRAGVDQVVKRKVPGPAEIRSPDHSARRTLLIVLSK
jgi:hypothetical protein